MALFHEVVFIGVLTLLVFVAPPVCEGHGRLHEPASRATMWRHGFNSTINYQDNELFCGGFGYQYNSVNNGSCGVCGDPYGGEREHEAGGIYANGIITANYTQGQIIDVWVELTAHHKGYFEFKICAHNDVDTAVTQECLDEHPLHSWNDSNIRHYVGDDSQKNYYFSLQLPWLMTCEQFVFQWRYRGGNNWGEDEEGTGLGFGPQEEFRACSDVRITPDVSVTQPPPPPMPSTTTTTTTTNTAATATTTTTVPTTTKALTCKPKKAYKSTPGMKQWCKANCPGEYCDYKICKCK